MPTEADIYQALRGVHDPEIPINIVDLGLVYRVETSAGKVLVQMTLTAMGCPMLSVIKSSVKSVIAALDGVEEVEIEVIWEPRWTPDRISEAGRLKLGML